MRFFALVALSLPTLTLCFRKKSRQTSRAVLSTKAVDDEQKCGHSASECQHPDPNMGTLFTAECLNGGLGCMALGKKCCRFCGFGDFASISCPDMVDDDEQKCGHSASECQHPDPNIGTLFTAECLNGGMGCMALGKKCCRFCGFGDFASISCPDIVHPGPSPTPPQLKPTPFPTPPWPMPTFEPTPIPTLPDSVLLSPVDTSEPDPVVFEKRSDHRLPPSNTGVVGPKSTNKFWGNWVVADGVGDPIYPMPYALKWANQGSAPPALMVSHGKKHHEYGSNGRISYYVTPFITEFALGAAEDALDGGHKVVREDIFGIHVEVQGPGWRKIMYPIFSGMAYVSGRYTGGFTPKITSDRAIVEVRKVADGIWLFRNNGGADFRVYALDLSGSFAGPKYDFLPNGQMNQPFEGWVRMARMNDAADAEILDAHAQAIPVACDLEVTEGGSFKYVYTTEGPTTVPLLHWGYAHHEALMETTGTQKIETTLTKIEAPTKGLMRGIVGNVWALRVDLTEVEHLGFLPDQDPNPSHVAHLTQETEGTLEHFTRTWKSSMFKESYYFAGKGFQKIGMICLLSEKFFGRSDPRTQKCAELLANGFRCLYDRQGAEDCDGAPPQMYYDEQWKGVVTSTGYTDDGCFGGADFGNACYNDHHYHFGYFVVSAAILARLAPAYRHNMPFVNFVNMLIRDTTNPSSADTYFPRFRAFDWFDLHSWSHGLSPVADGKDQESTSEELNLLYGIHLWSNEVGLPEMQQLATIMLASDAEIIKEYFLMKNSNPHHHPDFVKNHATGIFFQNKVDYATWFGADPKYIHGIQMLPLSPALQLTRKFDFCKEEWDDIISKQPLSLTDPWSSILLSGSLAIVDPDRAYSLMNDMQPGDFDDGLTKVWALYWASIHSLQ